MVRVMQLWFVVPVHGRVEKTHACLRQLGRTVLAIELMTSLEVHVAVVGDDESLDVAADLGFEAVHASNWPLGRKWNDGYHHACMQGADFCVPLGSDDWVIPELFADLPGPDEFRCSRSSVVVSEDGRHAITLHITYDGGDGVRVMPRALLEKVSFRPADDRKDRAIDTSILQNLWNAGCRPSFRYLDLHPYQIVDFKTGGADQRNTYEACRAFQRGSEVDPWGTLAEHYPAEALKEMRAVYGLPVKAAA